MLISQCVSSVAPELRPMHLLHGADADMPAAAGNNGRAGPTAQISRSLLTLVLKYEAECSSKSVPYTTRSDRSHIDETAVVTLEGNGYGRRRTIPVLSHDQVSLPGAW